MTLKQLQALKRWHVAHRLDHPMEYVVFDAVLTAWVLGIVGLPPALLLDGPALLPLCLMAFMAPELYRALRVWLHRSARLRCDWLVALK